MRPRERELILQSWKFRHLIGELARREFVLRHRGSYIGALWSLLQPFTLLAIYTLAFSVMSGKDDPLHAGGGAEFALKIFPGLVVFQALADVLNKSPQLVSGNPVYVKKVVFPLEVLPISLVLVALAHAMTGLTVWMLAHAAFFGQLPAGALFIPLLLALFAPVLLGMGWVFAALGVFYKDLSHLTGPLGQALLFLSPVFYRLDGMQARFQSLLLCNPLTLIVDQMRSAMELGEITAGAGLGLYGLASWCFAWLAWHFFRSLRGDFADLV